MIWGRREGVRYDRALAVDTTFTQLNLYLRFDKFRKGEGRGMKKGAHTQQEAN